MVKLDDILKYYQPTKYIVESTDYNEDFETPVLTAGKSLLLGYTEEKEGVFNEIPAIIFDDFTTSFHYIDYPFKVKSSAMKILVSRDSNVNIKYVYYRMLGLAIDTTLHKRYWISKYSQLKIPLPDLPTQKRIASILDDVQALKQKIETQLKEYDALAQSIFLDMFGDPVTNPKGWEKKLLKDITGISSGSTPSRKNENNFIGKIPWVKTGEVKSTVIIDTEEKISEEALKNSSCKLYPRGSLIIAMYGQGKTRGKVGVLGVEASTNQACAVLIPSKKMNFTYLYEFIKMSYEDLRRLGRGGGQPNLNAGLIKNYKVLSPPIKLQNEFAEKVTLIEQQKELAKQELKESEDLFNCLLQKAFKGEIV